MNEKELTMNEATQLWWFVGWRAGLTLIVINVLFKLINKAVALEWGGVMSALSLIISILVSVYFFRKAVNRNYKTFRISAHPLSSEKVQ